MRDLNYSESSQWRQSNIRATTILTTSALELTVKRDLTLIHVIACMVSKSIALHWHHNGRDSVSNHQPHDCLLNHLFRRRPKKTSKLCVTGLCVGNSPGTGEFPAQMACYAENVSIWWRHHGVCRHVWGDELCSQWMPWSGDALLRRG